MCDQVCHLVALRPEVPLLGGGVVVVEPSEVPAERIADGDDQRTAVVGAVGELGVLQSPATKRRVAAAEGVVERFGYREVAADHSHEDAVVGGGKVVGVGQQAAPPGWLRRAPRGQQVAEIAAVGLPRRIQPVRRYVGAEAERDGIGDHVVPARMGREQVRFGHDVAVDEHEDAVAGGARAGVARTCEPEALPLLADHGQVEVGGGPAQRRVGAVVDDDDVEEFLRIGLPCQAREHKFEVPRRLVVGHHDAHCACRRESVGCWHRDLTPVVAAHAGRLRLGPGRVGGHWRSHWLDSLRHPNPRT